MGGVIVGGWEFVWAAYGVSLVVLLLYSVSVHTRYKAEMDRGSAPGDKADGR